MRIQNVTKNSCELIWETPEQDGGSPITGYYVERSSQRSKFVKVDKNSQLYLVKKITDLVEGAEYELRVVAENKVGLSQPSGTTGIFIAKDAVDKPGPPKNVTVSYIKIKIK